MNEKHVGDDLVVLLPGILGSSLERNGVEVWGASTGSILRNLLTFGEALKELELNPYLDDEPNDGVESSHPIPSLGIIPTFWKVDGYGRLETAVLSRFLVGASEPRAGVVAFPYDWRLSCRVNARLLAKFVDYHLGRWRQGPAGQEAKLVLICHSMGGLIARWYLDCLGGEEVTRTLITLGTPYRGSLNALSALSNGVRFGVGPLKVNLDKLVRSFPSVYELLPTYEVLETDQGTLATLLDIDVPNVSREAIAQGRKLHDGLKTARTAAPPKYRMIALKGIDQPTAQSGRIRDGGVEMLLERKGIDQGGDGTVPRISSHPVEWEQEGTVMVAQTHAMLQSTKSLHDQVLGILGGHVLGRPLSSGVRLRLIVPEIVTAGARFVVEVMSHDSMTTLPLQLALTDELGKKHKLGLLEAVENCRYTAQVDGLSEGAWLVEVSSPVLGVAPVADWIVAWPAK